MADSVYMKLANVKDKLINLMEEGKLEQSGKVMAENKKGEWYAKYTYYELSDIVTTINKLNKEEKLLLTFINKDNQFIFTLINLENSEEKMVFEFKEVISKRLTKDGNTVHEDPIKLYGSTLTYMRRYAMLCIYDLPEPDMVDNVPEKIEPKKATEKQINTLINTIKNVGSKEKIKELFGLMGLNRPLESKEDYAKLLTDKYEDVTQEQIQIMFEFKNNKQ